MQVAFRVDASRRRGHGHVVRCLSLADSLKSRGANCCFISREEEGHLFDMILSHGHQLLVLPRACAGWQEDAAASVAALAGRTPDWLVLDSYDLNVDWESSIKAACGKLLVIDDLVGRQHDCHVLLDQNLQAEIDGHDPREISSHCVSLLGPKYALVRPAFAALRAKSLSRRRDAACSAMLVCMGGSDPLNETGKVIEGLIVAARRWNRIDVVVGQAYVGVEALRERLESLPGSRLHIQTDDMANLMAQADFAITSGGSISWEKCTLGLPSLVTILADNQAPVARAMDELGAQITLGFAEQMTVEGYAKAIDDLDMAVLSKMSARAAVVCDGGGAGRVADHMWGVT